ncbi:MAG: diguanylate cyclase [Spirochaetales bacterium]|nr:diguanylate cyclase [Spirochaetales bacterium]
MDSYEHKKILIVADSNYYGLLMLRKIENVLNCKALRLTTYHEAENYLQDNPRIDIALIELNLPDAPDGEIVDMFLKHSIPSIVITTYFIENVKEYQWTDKVVEYVIKEGGHTCDYMVTIIERFFKNSQTKVLIAGNSKENRSKITELLKIQNLQTIEASNGLEALELIEKNPAIKLLLTDYNMPEYDGFFLTKSIRKKYSLDRLAIIGMTEDKAELYSSMFIKHGANDVISKSFINSQLLCRINQNLKLIDQFETLREFSIKDPLTQIYNRRYLFEAGENLFQSSLRSDRVPIIGMIDIDHFKRVNDTHGHDIGDYVLKKVAQELKHSIRKSDILARYGGEEFCVIANNMEAATAPDIFDQWRGNIENLNLGIENINLRVTISIGLCLETKSSFMAMIKKADEQLYKAKSSGRNKVCY